MIKVLSLTTIYPNEQFDAEGRSVLFLDRALAKAGIAGTTLVLKPWAPRWMARKISRWRHLAVRRRRVVKEGADVIFSHYLHLPVRYGLNFGASMMAAQAIRLVRRNRLTFDLVHGEGICPSALSAYRVARHFGLPFIITLRDDLSSLRKWYEERDARKLFDPMFASVSAIFLIGPAQMKEIDSFIPAGASPRLILAPNGVDVEGLESVLHGLPPNQGKSWGHIVSVGNLYRFKGIHENLRALQILDRRGHKDWLYTVIGSGPFQKELEDLARELGLQDRVRFLGRIPHREAIGQIRGADIFSLPSWEEPFGNVYAEAAVCGRPAIGVRGFGAEMTIQDGRTGILVPPKDVAALADALFFLLTHPDRARRMGEEAEKHVRQFTWDRTARIYKEVIENLLPGGPAH